MKPFGVQFNLMCMGNRASKEMFNINDPQIMIINKRNMSHQNNCIPSYYSFISLLIYGMYQIVVYFIWSC